MTRLAAALAISVALAGCGGSKSDREQVVSVTQRYITALASGNGSEACSLLTGEAKQQLARAAAALRAFGGGAGGPTCESEIAFVHKLLGADQVALIRKSKLAIASLSGSSASVRVTTAAHVGDFPLSKTAAGWLISKPTTPGEAPRARPEGPSTEGTTTETPPPERPSGEGPVGYVHESFPEFEAQLKAGQISEATINKRVRGVRLLLTDGRHLLVKYAPKEEGHVASELRAHHVHVSVLSPTQAKTESGGG